jgi:hypothetical protein
MIYRDKLKGFLKKSIISISAILLSTSSAELAKAQVENIPVFDPVYSFLVRAEAMGVLKHFSTSMLPLSREQIVAALKELRANSAALSGNDIKTLIEFEKYFEIIKEEKLTVFYSDKDTSQVFSKRFLDPNPKYIYHYSDPNHTVRLSPLASFETIAHKTNDGSENVGLGNLGVRLSGTLSGVLGYYLQATNGMVFFGDRKVAMLDQRISQNIKFVEYNSDFDYSESSITFKKDWFYASIGRESRLWGSGINTNWYSSLSAPPFTTISLGARFSNFEYRFSHGSLLAYYDDSVKKGFNAAMPSKYITTHRFAVRPSWGEIGFWESVIYSKRNMDLEYLNPLSFYKSLEHALRDRDNSMMGLDWTIRPISRIEIKGTFILDDIIFGEIGKDFWSNKYAWNLGAWYASPYSLDLGLEYARIEPYTFSHFDSLNSFANDQRLIGGAMEPNSEEYSLIAKYWYGERFPIQVKIGYRRHGDNVYDPKSGAMIKNVGGDFKHTRGANDSERVEFLDGDLEKTFTFGIEGAYELFRDFFFKFKYSGSKLGDSKPEHIIRVGVSYENF